MQCMGSDGLGTCMGDAMIAAHQSGRVGTSRRGRVLLASLIPSGRSLASTVPLRGRDKTFLSRLPASLRAQHMRDLAHDAAPE